MSVGDKVSPQEEVEAARKALMAFTVVGYGKSKDDGCSVFGRCFDRFPLLHLNKLDPQAPADKSGGALQAGQGHV